MIIFMVIVKKCYDDQSECNIIILMLMKTVECYGGLGLQHFVSCVFRFGCVMLRKPCALHLRAL